MYKLARNHTGLVTNHPWDWYLDQAFQTTAFLFKKGPNGRSMVGNMGWSSGATGRPQSVAGSRLGRCQDPTNEMLHPTGTVMV